MQRSALCRSRRELSNEYLLAEISVDTAENEPLEVWGKIIQYYSFVSLVHAAGGATLGGAFVGVHQTRALSGLQTRCECNSFSGNVLAKALVRDSTSAPSDKFSYPRKKIEQHIFFG